MHGSLSPSPPLPAAFQGEKVVQSKGGRHEAPHLGTHPAAPNPFPVYRCKGGGYRIRGQKGPRWGAHPHPLRV